VLEVVALGSPGGGLFLTAASGSFTRTGLQVREEVAAVDADATTLQGLQFSVLNTPPERRVALPGEGSQLG
jgi:hypothetical protein